MTVSETAAATPGSALAALITSAEQAQLADAVARFVRERYVYADWRVIVDREPGLCERRWREMAGMGWLAVGVPEALGGVGGTVHDALRVVEGLAAGLAAEPLVASWVCADVIAGFAPPARRAPLLAPLLDGTERRVLAPGAPWTTAAADDPTALRAVRERDGWRLTGRVPRVPDAPHAHAFLVRARLDEAPAATALFAVPADAAGLALRPQRTFDRRRIADLAFEGVALPVDALWVGAERADAAMRRAQDLTLAAFAAESAGLGGWLVDATRRYLAERVQFGAPLASFQVLQHRLVDMYVALEELRTAARLAALACERGAPGGLEPSIATVKVAQAGRAIGRDALQLHGGMGMTDALPVGDYVKRLEAIALLCGGADAHLDRIVDAWAAG